jgi:hypothetical protein
MAAETDDVFKVTDRGKEDQFVGSDVGECHRRVVDLVRAAYDR